LKIETLPRDDHQVTLTVEIEAERMETARRRAARKIAEHAKIPGFRPGKAPYDVVRRMYGEAAINEEATQLLVEEVYPLAVKEADIKPAAQGELEKVESLDPPKFVFTIPLAPTVELGDYKSIRVPYEWTVPGDDKLEEAILDLRRRYSKSEIVERPVEEGDFVLTDIVGSKAKPKEGDDPAPLIEQEGQAITIRTDVNESESPFPGFSKKLIGMKPGEEIEFSHKFDKEYPDEAIKGQNVKFKVKVRTVRSVTLPELNDDFAIQIGLGQTIEEMRTRLREMLETESHNEYDDKYYEDIIDQIRANATVKYPPQVLAHETEHVLENLSRRLHSQGIDNLESYFTMIGISQETFIEEQAKPAAQNRLERGLILDELATAEKIEVDEQSLEQEFRETWESLLRNDQEFYKSTKGGARPTREQVDAVAMSSAHQLVTKRVLARIKSIAMGEESEEKPAKPKKKKAAAESTKQTPAAKTAAPKKKKAKVESESGEPAPAAAPKAKKKKSEE